MLKTYSPEE